MRILDTSTAELSASELEDLYAFPAALSRPWICVNLVSSVDGAVSLDGHSSALSDVADRRIFLLGRALSDVVLVGAGTARAEDYRGARTPSRVAKLRERLGLSAAPPIAVVSASCAIDPDSRLLTDTAV
ncbi:MAG: dihydrofolate reductase family protein, partial [Sciscionella sp.]